MSVPEVVDAAALLADVSLALADEPEPDRALALVLERLLPLVADWGTVRLREDDGRVRRVAAIHHDPAKADLVAALIESRPFDAPPVESVEATFARRRSEVMHDLDQSLIDELAPDPAARAVWAELGLRSVAIVPLMGPGAPVGSIVLVMADERRFDPSHLRVVEGIAIQCALLVKNTRLVREKELANQERTSVRVLLDSLMAYSPTITAILDDELRLLHTNEAFAAMSDAGVGVPLAEALPQVAAQLVPFAQAALTEGRSVDRALVRTSGREGRRSFQATAFPVDRGDGRRFGVGIFLSDVTEERRVATRLSDTVARLDLSLAAGGVGSWDWDFLRKTVVWSGSLATSLGIPPDAFGLAPEAFPDAVHEDDRERFVQNIVTAAREAGEFNDEIRVVRTDGDVRWLELRGRVITDAGGTPRRMIGVAADITERHLIEEVKARLLLREHQARVEAEAARERLALVAEASASLISTLDPQTVLDSLPGILVPRFADWCVVDVLDDDGDLVEVALVHRDPAMADAVRETRRRRQVAGGDGIWSVRRAVRNGAAELVVDIGDDDLAAVAIDDEHLAILRSLAPRSAIVAPMVARGRVLGGITLVATDERRFEPDDLTLAENLAGRAALAVDNGRLFESRGQVARALQQTLLPPALPPIEHLDLAARYRVASGGMDIGGDFYDVLRFESGAWMVVVGDVCGKGPAAAAVTGLFRHTLRALAVKEDTPAALLRGTNDALLGQIDDTQFCTAALVSITPAAGSAHAVIACGGHPRPMVVRAGGAVERVEVAGTLLGVLPEPSLPEVGLDLASGDALVLYTDGVTEARRGSEQFGESGLYDTLREAAAQGIATADALADHLAATVDAYQAGPPSDDRAILVVRVD